VGNGFVKTAPNGQKLADFFINTEAYDNLMTELMQNEDTFINFMSGCLNKNAQERVQAEIAKLKNGNSDQGDKPGLTLVDKK